MNKTKNFSVFPSTKMLPMDDIAQELKIVHRFASADQKAIDTESVAGVPASNIAIIAVDENGNPLQYTDDQGNIVIDERESVKNALNLAGIPANEYLTKEEGAVIENFGENVAKTYADEIAALRDELYQLRGELTRNGFVQEYGLYSGFQDFFRTSDKKYLVNRIQKGNEIVETIELCGLSPNFINSTNVKKIIPSQIGVIKTGDWFMISKTDTDEHYLVKATNVELITSEEEVTFESSISVEGIPSIDNPTKVIITKVHGDYYNGTYSFSKVEDYTLTNKERYTMLNDDSNPTLEKVVADKTGYAATFKVPQLSAGALKYFSVMARITGSPGALTCYVLEESKMNSIVNLSLEEVGPGKALVAKSKPISSLMASNINLTELEFDFRDPVTSKYPLLSGDTRYCCVVVAEQAGGADFWEIQFSKNMNSVSDPDVQTNNHTYTYTQGVGFTMTNTIGDLIFILATITIKENSESPRTEGIYTSQKIHVTNNSSLARARLMLRINREGLFTSETKGIVNDNGVIKVKTTGINPDNLGIKSNDTIIIGNQIRKALIDVNAKTIAIDKAISVEEGTPVYKMGYQVFLRAVKNEWITGANPRYEITSDICLPMELKAIMPDDNKVSDAHSERLVFECEFRDAQQLPIDANEFYLQIVWKSHLTQSDIISNDAYTGRIYDMTLSFDRTL